MHLKKWIFLYITIPILTISIILTFNFIIDPYSLTNYNLLNIPNKFARDDRKEKVAKLYKEKKFDNMLFGSSRVYSINPFMVSKYINGRTYNAGVGTARIEDHLGFLLYLEKLNKLPKNIIIGLDFYSFNNNLETNTYFLQNDELNFMKKSNNSHLYFSKFISLDATRASIKTLKHHLTNNKNKPRFDKFGAVHNASNNFSYKKTTSFKAYSNKELKRITKLVTTVSYKNFNQKRFQYIKEIINICDKNSINYKFYITPMNTKILDIIKQDNTLNQTFTKFKAKLKTITNYYDFATDSLLNKDRDSFGDALHFQTFANNILIARLFNDNNISFPENFGNYIESVK